MYVRLAFAVAAHLEPEILIVDEVLAVATPIPKEMPRKNEGRHPREGRTVLFVSHNMGLIEKLSPTSIWLDGGSIRHYGSTETVIRGYLSQGTLKSGSHRQIGQASKTEFWWK